MLRSRRQQLHARIATTLEEISPEIAADNLNCWPGIARKPGLTTKAVFYRLNAGQQWLARSAALEAATQLEKGLALLSGLPADAQRRQQELEFQIALGRAFQATKVNPRFRWVKPMRARVSYVKNCRIRRSLSRC